MNTVVSVVMGSTSDWETMKEACIILDEFGIAYEKKVVSAHRTPDLMFTFAEQARGNESHHCRRGRRSAPSGHDCRENDASGHRCSGPIARFERNGFFVVHRPDARWCSGCDGSDRQSRGNQCRSAGRADPFNRKSGFGRSIGKETGRFKTKSIGK